MFFFFSYLWRPFLGGRFLDLEASDCVGSYSGIPCFCPGFCGLTGFFIFYFFSISPRSQGELPSLEEGHTCLISDLMKLFEYQKNLEQKEVPSFPICRAFALLQ